MKFSNRNILIGLLITVIITAAVIYFVAKNGPVTFQYGRYNDNKDSGGIAVLCYHHLAPMELGKHINNNAVVPVEIFKEQMEYLHSEGFYTASMEELEQYLKGEINLPEKTVVITFDDGYESNYVYAYPILREYNMKATIFVIGSKIPEKNGEFKPEVLTNIDEEQLRELNESGIFSFEGHTFDLHKYIDNKPAVYKMNNRELDLDFTKFKEFCDKVGIKRPTAISYPFGVVTNNFIKTALEHGYRLGFTIKPGYVKPGHDLMKLNRFVVYPYYSIYTFGEIVNGQWSPETNKPKGSGDADYDLIVVGSDPEGIAAAVSASRLGLRTLLIDSRDQVGGLMTLGGLATIDMNYSPEGSIVTLGIFKEFYDKLGRVTSFDIETARAIFDDMLKESKVTVVLEREDIQPLMEDSKITGIEAYFKGSKEVYTAEMVIDATQDADIAAASGVPYTTGMEDIGLNDRQMVATLIFRLKGVNWERVREYLNGDGDKFTGADDTSAWGYSIMYKYKPLNPNLRMRGLNMARQKDGSVLVNALQIFYVDPLSRESREKAMQDGINELPRIIEFMNKNCPGLENAELAGTARELYIRESRHIIGEYRLTINDVLENRYFEDTIAFGSYPVDIQPTSPQDYGMVVGNPAKYGIPFRCLVPLKVDNLLVVGRAASFDSLAAGSARTIPVGMGAGEAAGVAARYSLDNNLTFREIAGNIYHVIKIREMLNKQGGGIYPFSYNVPNQDHWSYPYIRRLRARGLIYGRYDNNYFVDEQIPNDKLSDLMNTVFSRIDNNHSYIPNYKKGKATTRDVMTLLSRHLGAAYNIDSLYDSGMIGDITYNRWNGIEVPTYGHIYALLSDILDYYEMK